MDTFSSDYISNIPMGITSNVVRGIPRTVKVPVKTHKLTSKDTKKVKEISEVILKIADMLNKVS
jgi:phosphoheptose isomerase